MIELLEISNEYLSSGKVSSIRCSTRPDYINEDILHILKKYGVKTIELGLQSTSDTVLNSCKRGHSSKDEIKSCNLIKSFGFDLVGQMMIGLPSSTLMSEIETAKFIASVADGARIYPTVTFFGTELAEMAERGEYSMLSVDDAVYRSKEVLKVFRANSVDCIRIGLCASDKRMDRSLVKGGANHPALGELVIGELYYDEMRKLLLLEDKKLEVKGKNISIVVPSGETSKAIGQNGRNKNRLIEEFGMNKLKISESKLSLGVSVSIDE
jgi:histone acetyltransferase (RNA polymerase elongator complex component)